MSANTVNSDGGKMIRITPDLVPTLIRQSNLEERKCGGLVNLILKKYLTKQQGNLTELKKEVCHE